MAFIDTLIEALRAKGHWADKLPYPRGGDMFYLFVDPNITGFYENFNLSLSFNALDQGSIPRTKYDAAHGHVQDIYGQYKSRQAESIHPEFEAVLQIIENTYRETYR